MYERMLNKLEKPTSSDLNQYCGSTSEMFQTLNSFLTNDYKTTQEIRFPYGKDYGWCITHRKGKKLVCDIFAEVDAFTIMLRLSNEQFDEVYNGLQPYAKQLIDNKYPCGGGGWIYYRVTSVETLNDIKTLLTIKFKKL